MVEQISQTFDISRLRSTEFITNPHSILHELRNTAPIIYVEMYGIGTWWLSRYNDVTSCLSDPRLFQMAPRLMVASIFTLPDEQQEQFDRLVKIMSKWLLAINPPEHTRLRHLLSPYFSPAALQQLRPRIEKIVDSLLARLQDRGKFDLIADFAYPLPAIAIGEIIGVPEEKQELIIRCSDLIASELGLKASLQGLEATQQASIELTEYLRELLGERRKNPREDLLSAIARSQTEGEVLSDDEILAECHMLLFAGHETTRYLIRNGVATLLKHPKQLQLLREHPELMRSAIEEILRYESPLFATSRVVAADTDFCGQPMQKDQVVLSLIAAANRDPAQFENPDCFDIAREPNKHIAFGGGSHFCLGANLARMEAEIAFHKLFEQMPNLHLAPESEKDLATFGLRHLNSLFLSC
jgi:pimeloyl-[acyl-carrier protein] synthase